MIQASVEIRLRLELIQESISVAKIHYISRNTSLTFVLDYYSRVSIYPAHCGLLLTENGTQNSYLLVTIIYYFYILVVILT